MNILISGIHGFVGTNLVSAYKSQHAIYGLDIISPQKDGVLNTFAWDELNKISEIDTIIHLAGKAHDTKNQSNAEAYFEINTGLTKKIFDWFLTSTTEKFIFFSSVKAVADSVNGPFLTEHVKPNPKTPYGKSKLEAEWYIQNQQIPLGKKVYILRPSMIHGPGNKGNLNLLYKFVTKGIPWPLGEFDNKRSFTSIDNLTFILKQIIENDIVPGVYNVSDDNPISTNRLIALIAESRSRKVKIWKLNQKLISFGAKLGDILHLPLDTERLNKLTESYVVSNFKIKKALGITELPISAEDGMRKTLISFQENKIKNNKY